MNGAIGLGLLAIVVFSAEMWSIQRGLGSIRKTLDDLGAVANGQLDCVARELDRVGGILGDIFASMPPSPPKAEPRSDWDRLRAQLGVEKPGSK